ncbi:glycosyltransferase family 4 protein [Flavobacterium sp.]|uniref:glycosyltransferase family 4 protein n=1 Tax=Flavobacterium sp. TaxID=239 RepID=UPI0039E5946F
MHICYLTNEYPRPDFPHGGIGSFIKTMATELVKHGFRVSVVGMNYVPQQEAYTEEGVHVYRLIRYHTKGLSWWNNFREINRKIREIHAEHPIDVVESAELGLAFLQKLKGIRYVIRLHGGHHFFAEGENRGINWWKGFQEKRSFARADAFVAVSDYVKSHTHKYLSYHGNEVPLISNPINTDLFQPLNIPVVPGRIVFAGTVCEKKGIRQLIQAFPIVKRACPSATLEIYGRDWQFPDGSSYIEMLHKKEFPQLGDAGESIHFHGSIAHVDIPKKYAEAEVCVFPSHMETQGLVAPEAMVMQKTVVFTKLGPGPETIEDGKTGLLCDPYQPQDIADKIIWALQHPAEVKQIQQNGAAFARNKYALEPIVQKNIAFYQTLRK